MIFLNLLVFIYEAQWPLYTGDYVFLKKLWCLIQISCLAFRKEKAKELADVEGDIIKVNN